MVGLESHPRALRRSLGHAAGAFDNIIGQIQPHKQAALITHPGFVDAECLDISTHSVVRARDQFRRRLALVDAEILTATKLTEQNPLLGRPFEPIQF